MAREATIIGHAQDYKGNSYDVREIRPTPHGFDVLLGWPDSLQRGQGGSGPKVILTTALADFLVATKLAPAEWVLPIGGTTIKRLRRELALNWYRDKGQWWLENPDGPGEKPSTKSVRRKKMELPSSMFWTPEEDEKLMALYRHKSATECGRVLNKSECSVRARISRLRQKGLFVSG